MYVAKCILSTAECSYIILGSGITEVCTSAGSYGSVRKTSRLPSLLEEQESQQQQYNLNRSDCIMNCTSGS